MRLPSLLRPAGNKSARNEDRKLTATTVNAVALAVLGLGLIAPFFANPSRFDVLSVLSGVIFVVLHVIARIVARRLEE